MYTPYISLSFSCNIPVNVLFEYKLCYTCFSSQSCMFMYVTCLSLQILVLTLLIIMCVVIIYTQNAIEFMGNVQYYVEYLHDIPVVMGCSNRFINIYKSNMMACYQTQIILIILHVCLRNAMTFYSTPSTVKSLCIFLNVDHRPYWELLLLLYAMFKSLTYLTFPKWLFSEFFSRHLKFIILCLISSSKLFKV